MSQQTFSLIAGLIFACVAIIHLWRIWAGWDITVADLIIPLWVSWVGLIVTGILGYYGLRFGMRKV